MTAAPVALGIQEASAQSLASGAAGVALLHVEQALAGSGDWQLAHRHLQHAVAGRVDAGTHAGLFYGVPAIAFVLHAASADGNERYQHAAKMLDDHVVRLAHQRVSHAEHRMSAGRSATFGEYDLFYGLTGLGVLLLGRLPGNDALARIMSYLVALTRPRRYDGLQLPGWWVAHDPDTIVATPGGHANLGMAHGAAGVLAALSLTVRRGVVVDGQIEAIERLCGWFDRWRQDTADGPWWPPWVTRDELRAGRPVQPAPGRPSWCYGTVGTARALQLAAIATGDHSRQIVAEEALAASLTRQRLASLTGPGLCHGMAGVYQVAFRAACDAINPAIAQRLPVLATSLSEHAKASRDHGRGLLTGQAGVGLALETARCSAPPRSGWDTCLLIT